MVNWNSPQEILIQARAFSLFMHVLLGLSSWEFVCSFWFDWCYITRRRKFQWPLVPYFACRYSLLLTMVCIAISANASSDAFCHPLFLVVELAGHAATGFACISFAIQTITVWDRARWVIILSTLVALGHWALILQTGIIKTGFSSLSGCYISDANHDVQIANFAYSVGFDLLLLVLIAIKLPRSRSSIPLQLLRHNTLPYIFFAFVLNCLATIFMCLNLNSVMASILVFPSVVCSAIMATRCVRHVINQSVVNSQGLFQHSSTVVFRREDEYTGQTLTTTFNTSPKRTSNGMHIQMQTFVIANADNGETSTPADVESQVLPSESSCNRNL